MKCTTKTEPPPTMAIRAVCSPPKTDIRAAVCLLLFTHVFWHSLLGNEMRWVEMLVTKLCSWHFSYISGSSFLDSKCLENELLKCESGLCIENCKTGRGWLAALLYQRSYFFFPPLSYSFLRNLEAILKGASTTFWKLIPQRCLSYLLPMDNMSHT